MLKKCVCPNAFMDARYGRMMRVVTTGQSGNSAEYRCCSCGRPIAMDKPSPQKAKKNKKDKAKGKARE